MPPTSPKPLTLTSSRLPSNDHVTILGAVENLVNMLKSMSPCLPTISFPLQSPCLQCQAAISVSMTRLRVLLSLYHPHTAAYTPSSSEAVSSYTRMTIPYKPAARAAHHTISHNRRFALSYCLPRPFVSSPTARILSLSDPTASCPTQNSKNVRAAQKFNEFCAPTFQLNRTKGMVCSIQVHPAICQSTESESR